MQFVQTYAKNLALIGWTSKRLNCWNIYFRSEITEKENRLEKISNYKHFVILIFHNFTNLVHRPITIEQFLVLPNHRQILDSISLLTIDSDSFAIKEQRPSCPDDYRLEEFSPDDLDYELEEMESRNLRLIENWQASGIFLRIVWLVWKSRRFKNKFKADEVLDVMRSHASTLRPVSKFLACFDWSINSLIWLVEQ